MLGYPSKSVLLKIPRPTVIFRSDSNGEDLEGYAGAGLYESVPMDKEQTLHADYSSDPLVWDQKFQADLLTRIAEAGVAIEARGASSLHSHSLTPPHVFNPPP